MADNTNEKLQTDQEKHLPADSKNTRSTHPNHVLRKRLPISFPKNTKDVYVTNKTQFQAQVKKCEKLLDEESEIIIHGLGAAINRACHLALWLQKNHHGTLDLDIKTSTVELTDDLEPLTDDGEYEINTRKNSSIHIRVFKIVEIGSLKYVK